MNMLLVLSPEPGFAEALRSAVDPRRFRVLHCNDPLDASLLLGPSGIDACILDRDLGDPGCLSGIINLRSRFPRGPLFLVTSLRSPAAEEEAYLRGATHVLAKPVRPALLTQMLERTIEPSVPGARSEDQLARGLRRPAAAGESGQGVNETLNVLRRVSEILAHSVEAESLVREFLLVLREVLRVNRAAIYLRPRAGEPAEPADAGSNRRLRLSCVIGMPTRWLREFDLSIDTGIGGRLHQFGRILRRDSAEASQDEDVRKEFQMIGAQVAIPILDRENLLGIALLDDPLTHESFTSAELGLVFHLFEQLGMALKRVWVQEEAIGGHALTESILGQIQSACLVVDRDLKLIHANETARAWFTRAERSGRPLELADLPQVCAAKVTEVLQSGQPRLNFRFRAGLSQDRSFRAVATPFRRWNLAPPGAALLLVDDCTDEDELHTIQLETGSLRLVKLMAERVSHEVGNALVPLSTHQQLLHEQKANPEFMESLQSALGEGVRRVSRLASQMHFLSRDHPSRVETIPLEVLVGEAFREARRYQADSGATLTHHHLGSELFFQGDRASLRHAFYEILLNAIQAGASPARIELRIALRRKECAGHWIDLDFQDNGAGWSAAVAARATEPFFTTRAVGLGLGLTVAKRIIESHRGRLEIIPKTPAHPGYVRVSLPSGSACSPAPAD
jgi:nitrogen-specific signal transduction histidine kinase